MNKKLKRILKDIGFYTIVFFVSIVIAVLLRIFVVAPIMRIPTGSMEPTVLAGDKILVTKLIPGARVYKNIREIRVDEKVQTKRFKGTRKVKRNDVMVFNFPYTGGWDKLDIDLNVYYLKRCVALPGDTFSIENGYYRVNNYPDSLGCMFRQHELSQKTQPDFSSAIWKCFPHETENYQWNIKNFGPIYVPASGDVIAIDTFNYFLYKSLIEYESNKKLSVVVDSIFLNDELISSYTFTSNYYFMAGDFIYDSRDSRYWGLLPEECFIGKAFLVWRSTDVHTKKIRWNRFVKWIK